MASQSLPQKYRHSYTPQYLHPHYHPQIRRRKNATWDQRYRGCGSMWASESALTETGHRKGERNVRCDLTPGWRESN
ncbi:uncharacterized protein TNCV_4038501 [Trichonephila clavipes]|nr:uncharacterized protein TNCV_4038501 [Trichonephila clavipes]